MVPLVNDALWKGWMLAEEYGRCSQTMWRWANQGVINPAEGPRGTYRPFYFDLTEARLLVCLFELRDDGCSMQSLRPRVSALRHLLSRMVEGGTFVWDREREAPVAVGGDLFMTNTPDAYLAFRPDETLAEVPNKIPVLTQSRERRIPRASNYVVQARQAWILRKAESEGTVTTQDVFMGTDLPRHGANFYLCEMVRAGLLERVGVGVYRKAGEG